jgi:hypothetical protein
VYIDLLIVEYSEDYLKTPFWYSCEPLHNLDDQKLDILKLEKGKTGIVLEAHERPGWMSKYRVLFETGHAF